MKSSIFAAFVALLLASGCLSQGDGGASSSVIAVIPETVSSYSASEVSSHNSEDNCWTIVDGKVYNITGYIGKHVGGPQSVLAMCGVDGASLLRSKHGTSKDGILGPYYVGDLK
jgi:cytochrome b involved in lipid metabolism